MQQGKKIEDDIQYNNALFLSFEISLSPHMQIFSKCKICLKKRKTI